jgi:hypothetical protein
MELLVHTIVIRKSANKKTHLSAEKRGLCNFAIFLPPPWDVGARNTGRFIGLV